MPHSVSPSATVCSRRPAVAGMRLTVESAGRDSDAVLPRRWPDAVVVDEDDGRVSEVELPVRR